jgi:glycosyltransferase involved in cell wall biosynthesis
MKVLFITSEHPSRLYGGLGTFTREFPKALKQYCTIVTVYFHFSQESIPPRDEYIDYVFQPAFSFDAFTIEARLLENAASLRSQIDPILQTFKPDIIHCNDRLTFLPFRFESNVVYSSHLLFADLLSLQGMNDIYYQEFKSERCAILRSAIVFVYSSFVAERILSQYNPKGCPVVVPLGINNKNYYSEKDPEKIHIAYFGRFENVQKGFLNFIQAVALLEKDFIEQNRVIFSLYGKGAEISPAYLGLFETCEYLEGESLYNAYAKTDIVVMPSNYEPFGLVGLEAMASHCLLLCTEHQGMDEYAVPGKTCVTISNNPVLIAKTIKDVVSNYNAYQHIIENGYQESLKWTWQRSAWAHYTLFKLIKKNHLPNLQIAYNASFYKSLQQFKTTFNISDAEKVKALLYSMLSYSIPLYKDEKVLLLTVGELEYFSETVPKNWELCSVTSKNNDGLYPRLESLNY